MKYTPTEARVVLIDGPVAVFLHEAAPDEILQAYRRLETLVRVATDQFENEKSSDDSTRSVG